MTIDVSRFNTRFFAVPSLLAVLLPSASCSVPNVQDENVNHGGKVVPTTRHGQLVVNQKSVAELKTQLARFISSDNFTALKIAKDCDGRYDGESLCLDLGETFSQVALDPEAEFNADNTLSASLLGQSPQEIRVGDQLDQLRMLTAGKFSGVDAKLYLDFQGARIGADEGGVPGFLVPLTMIFDDALKRPHESHECFDLLPDGGGFAADVCRQVRDGLSEKVEDLPLDGGVCDIEITTRVNSLQFVLGFFPKAPDGSQLDDDSWNERAFGGGDLNLDHMGSIELRVFGNSEVIAHTEDRLDDIEQFTDGDIVVAGELQDCAYQVQTVCAFADCDQDFADELANGIRTQLEVAFADAIQGELRNFFGYSGSVYNSPIGMFGCSSFGWLTARCIDHAMNHLIPGSMTNLVQRWFFTPFNDVGPMNDHVVIEEYAFTDQGGFPIGGGTLRTGEMVVKYDADRDGDDVLSGTDNCPDKSNRGQLNSDTDMMGDACDVCPYTEAGDHDGDGVCDDEDNCIYWENPGQENSNELSEFVRGALELGDLCEPVPVPAATIDPGRTIVSSGDCTGASKWDWCTANGKNDASRFSVAPLRSNPMPSSGGTGTVPSERIDTHFRFCKTPEFAFELPCESAAAVTDQWLRIGSDAEDEFWTDPYHQITVVRLGGGTKPSKPPLGRYKAALRTDTFRLGDFVGDVWGSYPAAGTRGASHAMTYSNVSTLDVERAYRFQWNFEKDYWFWHDRWDEDDDSGIVKLSGYEDFDAASKRWSDSNGFSIAGPERLDGMLWSHAETEIGASENLGTGLHGDQLANNYIPIRPVHEWIQFSVPLLVPVFENRLLWFWPPLDEYLKRKTPSILYGHEGRLAIVDPSSQRGIDVTPWIGSGLQSTMMIEGARWVSQSEPLMGAEANAVLGVVLSHDGMELLDVAASGGDRLLGREDLRASESTQSMLSFIDLPDISSGSLRALAFRMEGSTNAALPEPIYDFHAVYSRSLDQLFVLGGVTETGEPNRLVWAGRPGDSLRALSADIELGDVLSAVVEPETESLIVIDKVQGFFLPRARIIRIDLSSEAVDVLESWPLFGLFDRYDLVADHGGKVVLAASSSARERHLLVRFDPLSGDVEALMPRAKALAMAPVVTSDGYQVMTVAKNGRMRAKVRRRLETKEERRQARWLQRVGDCF